MFEVSWTDPQRETVAQRRNRKRNQTGQEIRESGPAGTGSQCKPSILNLFDGNTRLGQGQESPFSKSTTSQSRYPTVTLPEASAYVPLMPDSMVHGSSTSTLFSSSLKSLPEPLHSKTDWNKSLSYPTTVESSVWTDPSTATESTVFSTVSSTDELMTKWVMVQILGPGSYVSKTTEITSSCISESHRVGALSGDCVFVIAEPLGETYGDPLTQQLDFYVPIASVR